MENKILRIAFVGVPISDDVAKCAREFEFEAVAMDSSGDVLKKELVRFSPDILFVHARILNQVFSAVPTQNRPSIFLAVEEGAADLPAALEAGVADDMVLLPIRRLDFLARLRWHQHLHALRSVEGINDSVRRLVQKVEEDIVFAQKIQRRLIKDRFPPMQGVSIKSRYWCGLRSGGDYFDVFEFADKNHIGFLLTDASSYGLSTAFLNSMIHLPSQLGPEEIQNPAKMVRRICAGLGESLSEKDQLSIFYGVLDRKSFVLEYIGFGKVFANVQKANGASQWIVNGQEPALTTKTLDLVQPERVREVAFEPEDRLMLLSDGVEEILERPLDGFLSQIEDRDPQIVLNEISFALRNKQDPDGEEAMAGEHPMPPQDCSVLLIDVAKNILRLAR